MAEEIMKAEPVATSIEMRPVVTCTSVDTTTFAGKAAMFNALNSAGSLADHGASRLVLKGLILQPYSEVDQKTGEVLEGYGVVFQTEDGDFYSRSAGIVRSAQNLIGAFGGVWPADEEVVIEIFETQLDSKRTLKQFKLVL